MISFHLYNSRWWRTVVTSVSGTQNLRLAECHSKSHSQSQNRVAHTELCFWPLLSYQRVPQGGVVPPFLLSVKRWGRPEH